MSLSGKTWKVIGLGVFVLYATASLFASDPPTVPPKKKSQVKTVSYKTSEIEDVSYPGCQRRTHRLTFPFKTTVPEIKATVTDLLNKNRSYCEVMVWTYLEGSNDCMVYYVRGQWGKKTGQTELDVTKDYFTLWKLCGLKLPNS